MDSDPIYPGCIYSLSGRDDFFKYRCDVEEPFLYSENLGCSPVVVRITASMLPMGGTRAKYCLPFDFFKAGFRDASH